MLSGNFKGSEIQHGIFLPGGGWGGGAGWWLIFGPRICWTSHFENERLVFS